VVNGNGSGENDMSSLFDDLQMAGQMLFAKPNTVITPADIPNFKQEFLDAMEGLDGWQLDTIEITLHDQDEMVTVKVTSGNLEEEITLEWRAADGLYYMRVDTDGDGK